MKGHNYAHLKSGSLDMSKIAARCIIAPLSDIPIIYIKYLTMHKVRKHAGAIRQLVYGCVYAREIIHSLKLVDYLPVHTHKPYNNSHLYHQFHIFFSEY